MKAPSWPPVLPGIGAGTRVPSLRRELLLGGLAGLAWGVVARLWMRLISDSPEFSWGGTLVIILGFGAFAAIAGCTRHARRLRRRGRQLVLLRTVTFLVAVPLATGAGTLVMVGVVVPGALALGRHDWWPPVRILLGSAAVLATAGISYLFAREVPLMTVPLGIPLFLAIAWVLAGWMRASFDPVDRRAG